MSEYVLCMACVYQKWFSKFLLGCLSVQDAPYPGRPTEINNNIIKDLVDTNLCRVTRMVRDILQISKLCVEKHLQQLGYISRFDAWVPELLISDHTHFVDVAEFNRSWLESFCHTLLLHQTWYLKISTCFDLFKIHWMVRPSEDVKTHLNESFASKGRKQQLYHWLKKSLCV